ncbi:glycoside hydrolase family 127 protein [Kaistia dalseonensis]|uniref:DUF1680 family protein n=1 Tax=Kaistia dalseonensis TaxID=410840 RepID=A0ABU0H0V8_9HYPH|nr:beta-L-arabinofuranosidase domain-containing protein [Kaistia dalseonensis]MCX5493380.1 glycoside hydrolase family 127 protein [Kaistia dalseonensis]MDQ0435938.1 DUF1680 family protein [Kaistia dalseonensis]
MTAGGKVLLEEFGFGSVTLLPGRFRTQVDEAAATYGALSNDSILKGFRAQSGQDAPGDAMGGWCAANSAVIFGQLVSGMVRLGRATHNQALVDKAISLHEGWLATLPADGNARMRLYDWEKLAQGLIDLHLLAQVESALPALRATTGWAERTFDRTRPLANTHDFWGAGPGDTSEWYILPEAFYRIYQATNDSVFKEFADLWLYEDYWAPFAEGKAPETVEAVHAYSHVNAFSSAAMAYAVTGEKRYLDICVHGYDFIQKTQVYATGAYGPDERLMPPNGSLGRSLECCAYHAEVPCGSWAGFKLSRYLMSFTGEARYGDWIETLLYNAIGSALPVQQDGTAFYYGDYRISAGAKEYYWQQWPCCSGTYIQDMAEYHNLVFFKDAAGLYVNLYLPSQLSWTHGGQTITVTQETLYPERDSSTLRFDMAEAAEFALRFRIPGWAKGAVIAVNGERVPVAARPGDWAVIDRLWMPSDSVTITIPMALRAVPIDEQHPDRVAMMYGPIVLAQDEACCRRPLTIAPDTALETRLIKDGDGPRFRITNAVPERHTRYLVPLYSFPKDWPYWVYFDLHAPSLY